MLTVKELKELLDDVPDGAVLYIHNEEALDDSYRYTTLEGLDVTQVNRKLSRSDFFLAATDVGYVSSHGDRVVILSY